MFNLEIFWSILAFLLGIGVLFSLAFFVGFLFSEDHNILAIIVIISMLIGVALVGGFVG